MIHNVSYVVAFEGIVSNKDVCWDAVYYWHGTSSPFTPYRLLCKSHICVQWCQVHLQSSKAYWRPQPIYTNLTHLSKGAAVWSIGEWQHPSLRETNRIVWLFHFRFVFRWQEWYHSPTYHSRHVGKSLPQSPRKLAGRSGPQEVALGQDIIQHMKPQMILFTLGIMLSDLFFLLLSS